MKTTHWERQLQASGFPIITWDHEEIKDYLLSCFRRDYAHLLSIALSDSTKRHTLVIVMNYHDMGGDNFGGQVTYNKKRNEFTHITYSDRRNYAVSFSINSGVSFFAYDHYKEWKHVFPFGASVKRLTSYLLEH